MPLALIIIAALLILTAIKGNYAAVGAEFNTTFFGQGSQSGFLVWFGSILGLAVLFRVIQAPKAGELFIALLILVYFLQNNSVLTTIENAIQAQGASSSNATSPGGAAVATSASQATPASAASTTANATANLNGS